MSAPHALSSQQRLGAAILTLVAIIVLPSAVRFFILYGHRVFEYSGPKLWLFICILVPIAMVGIWAIGMIGTMLYLATKSLLRLWKVGRREEAARQA